MNEEQNQAKFEKPKMKTRHKVLNAISAGIIFFIVISFFGMNGIYLFGKSFMVTLGFLWGILYALGEMFFTTIDK